MNIINRIKESKLRKKEWIYAFCLLNIIFIFVVYTVEWLRYGFVVLPSILWSFVLNIGPVVLFLAYFVFFFDNRQKKTIFFILNLPVLAVVDVILLTITIAQYYQEGFRNLEMILRQSGLYCLRMILLIACNILLAILARNGLRNKKLWLVFSIVKILCLDFFFLDGAIMIFGLYNYLPALNKKANDDFENKSDKVKLIILKEQFDDGIITEEEYKEQKLTILKRL